MGKPGFNIYEFKKWLETHPSEMDGPDCKMDRTKLEADPIIGARATPKTTEAKILSSLESVTGKQDEIISEFFANGGTTILNHGRRVVVEVAAGSFSIPRSCVKLEKKK